MLHLHKDFSFFFSRNATERIGNPFLEGKRTDLLFNSVKGPTLTHTPKKAEKEFRLSPSSFITYKQSAIIYTNDGLIVNIGHTLHRLQTNLQSTRVLPVELYNNKKQNKKWGKPLQSGMLLEFLFPALSRVCHLCCYFSTLTD